MNAFAVKVLGPRAAPELVHTHPWRFRLPSMLFVSAAVLLVISIFTPYWQDTMYAPQYPHGLTVVSYVNRLTGRVHEIDLLNEYIGMKPLEDAAGIEKHTAVFIIAALALLVIAAVEIHSPWTALLTLPALFFPFGFLIDLQFWLADFGLHLDPNAPLNMAVKPFVPHVLGEGHVGQFVTIALPLTGLYLSLSASILIVLGLWFQRRAFKPLRDKLLANSGASGTGPTTK